MLKHATCIRDMCLNMSKDGMALINIESRNAYLRGTVQFRLELLLRNLPGIIDIERVDGTYSLRLTLDRKMCKKWTGHHKTRHPYMVTINLPWIEEEGIIKHDVESYRNRVSTEHPEYSL